MPTLYKLLGAVSSSIATAVITSKLLTNGSATLTASAGHSFISNQQVSINLSPSDSRFDGLRIPFVTSASTFTFLNTTASNVSACATFGLAIGPIWRTLYTCPSNTSMICSSLVVCNRGDNAGYYMIAFSSSSVGQPSIESYITNGDIAAGRETIFFTGGLVADNNNRFVRVAATNNDFTFQLHGMEVT